MIKYWKPNGRIEKITEGLKKRVNRLVRETLKNIKVEVTDEFDRNFERDAFFNEKYNRQNIMFLNSKQNEKLKIF